MEKLISTYERIVQVQHQNGRIVTISHEKTLRIGAKISESFLSSQKHIEIRQKNSLKKLKNIFTKTTI